MVQADKVFATTESQELKVTVRVMVQISLYFELGLPTIKAFAKFLSSTDAAKVHWLFNAGECAIFFTAKCSVTTQAYINLKRRGTAFCKLTNEVTQVNKSSLWKT